MKHKVEVIPKEEILANRSNAYEFINFDKQETLEEAAERLYPHCGNALREMAKETFINGAKWQQERSYSEEEVYHILCEHTAFLFAEGKSTLTEWFEQFKKKIRL